MSWADYNASKLKPKVSYPDSKMKVYNAPERKRPPAAPASDPAPTEEIEVEEVRNASDTMRERIIRLWKGDKA